MERRGRWTSSGIFIGRYSRTSSIYADLSPADTQRQREPVSAGSLNLNETWGSHVDQCDETVPFRLQDAVLLVLSYRAFAEASFFSLPATVLFRSGTAQPESSIDQDAFAFRLDSRAARRHVINPDTVASRRTLPESGLLARSYRLAIELQGGAFLRCEVHHHQHAN